MKMADYNEMDLAIALQLQAQFEEERRVHLLKVKISNSIKDSEVQSFSRNGQELHEPEQEKFSVSLIDPSWELLDPNPKIHDLFLIFNDQFFWGRLAGIEVSWSPRMTLCAGVCSYERRGGLCSVRLSIPLLKLRPRKDLVETLLHEMIHAYLFVTKNNTDHDGHGPQFHEHMYRINRIAGTKISVYHQFHDEVDVYRQHIWVCNGPCRKQRPYYGLVKRSMNRAPSERDLWWAQHKMNCGGTFTKIKEPDGYGIKKKKDKSFEGCDSKSNVKGDIRKFFPTTQKTKSNLPGLENGTRSTGKYISHLNVSSNDSSKTVQSSANIHWIDIGNTSKKTNISKKPDNSKTRSNSIPGDESRSKRPRGSFGTGMGMRTVSKTFTVNQKKPSVEPKAPPTAPLGPEFTPFAGHGHSLGGNEPGTGRSRLLDLQSQSKKVLRRSTSIATEGTCPSSSDKKVSWNSSFNEESDHEKCPLCDKEINPSEFDDHISICMGDIFDNNDDDDFTSGNTTKSNDDDKMRDQSPASSKDNICDVVNVEHDDTEGLVLDDSVVILDTAIGRPFSNLQLYPCPVCSETFSEDNIQRHVNQHFS